MPKTVTYRGLRARGDTRSSYLLPTESGDLRFEEDKPVENVPDEIAAQLENTTGHRFEVEPEPKTAGKSGSTS
jgi:hypothetical protein